MRVTWSFVPGATRYEAWRSRSNVSATAVALASNVTASFYDDLTAAAGTYYYWVKAANLTGTSGFSASDSGLRVVGVAPTFTTPPQDQTVNGGQNASFTVAASGSPAPAYQWQRQAAGTTGFVDLLNTSSYSGATTATLTVMATTAAMRGDRFQCVATNGVSPNATSAAVTLTVVFAPAISSASRTKFAMGISGSFTITATGDPPLTFSVSSGALPSWLTLNPGNGVLSGTPPDAIGSPFSFTISASNGIGSASTQVFTLGVLTRWHSADTSPIDGQISQAELLRVIELYNTRNGTLRTGRYLVQPTGTEDGFNIDPTTPNSATVTLTRYHSADTNHDGKFHLVELTRVVELYNTRNGTLRTGQYHPQVNTEDGFAPGP